MQRQIPTLRTKLGKKLRRKSQHKTELASSGRDHLLVSRRIFKRGREEQGRCASSTASRAVISCLLEKHRVCRNHRHSTLNLKKNIFHRSSNGEDTLRTMPSRRLLHALPRGGPVGTHTASVVQRGEGAHLNGLTSLLHTTIINQLQSCQALQFTNQFPFLVSCYSFVVVL